MPRRRWLPRGRREPLTPAFRVYLESGDWQTALDEMAADDPTKLKLFQLAGQVIRGDLAALRELWREHGAEIKVTHPGLTFAEYQLRRMPAPHTGAEEEARR